MSRVGVTEYTSTQATTLVPPAGEHLAGAARAGAARGRVGALQWLLEGSGRDWAAPALDAALSVVAIVAALGGPHAVAHVSAQRAPLLALPPLALALLYRRGAYRRRLRLAAIDQFAMVFGAVTVAATSAAALCLLVNGTIAERGPWLRGWAFVLAAIGLGHCALAFLQRRARERRLTGRPTLIVGAGAVGTLIARRLEERPEYGLRAIGFLDDDVHLIPDSEQNDLPVLGRIDAMADVVAHTGVRDLVLAFSTSNDARLSRLVDRCQALGVEVSVVPRLFDTINQRISYDTLGGLPLLRFDGVDPSGLPFLIKHVVDRLVAALLLIVLLPVLSVVAVAVAVSSRGPILFRQRRVGRDGREFDLLKFRTMRVDGPIAVEPEPGEDAASLARAGTAPGGVEGPDRRTRVGRLLRRSSLDELPQLINVVRGEMSLVGPRPERPEFVAVFRDSIPRYGDRHRVKSGITGWAQVHDLRGQTSLHDRVEWDNYYIAHWSIFLDLKILALTFGALVRGGE